MKKKCPTLPHMSVSPTLSRSKEQQKETDDLGLNTQHKKNKQQYHTDFILPCPYLSGSRHPLVAEPARVLSPVMEVKMKRNEGEAKGKENLVSAVTLEAKVVVFFQCLVDCTLTPVFKARNI